MRCHFEHPWAALPTLGLKAPLRAYCFIRGCLVRTLTAESMHTHSWNYFMVLLLKCKLRIHWQRQTVFCFSTWCRHCNRIDCKLDDPPFTVRQHDLLSISHKECTMVWPVISPRQFAFRAFWFRKIMNSLGAYPRLHQSIFSSDAGVFLNFLVLLFSTFLIDFLHYQLRSMFSFSVAAVGYESCIRTRDSK